MGVQSDPVEFMSWLLNTLHADLRGSKKKSGRIIHDCFQGELEVVKEIQTKSTADNKENGDLTGGSGQGNLVNETSRMPFLMLGLNLLPPLLFQDAVEKNIISKLSLKTGQTAQGMPTKVAPARIACLDFNLQETKMQMGVHVLVTEPRELEKNCQR